MGSIACRRARRGAKLQADIRFGFGAFTGEVGQTCPMFDKVPIALNNSDAIATVYKKLGRPQKGETPTAKVLTQVRDILKADASPGEKYILFVTDGEPDYCDDPNPICPVDSVVGGLQALSQEKITRSCSGSRRPALRSRTPPSRPLPSGAGQPVAFLGAYVKANLRPVRGGARWRPTSRRRQAGDAPDTSALRADRGHAEGLQAGFHQRRPAL